MDATLQGRQDIADLMTGWIHRDLGEWEQLRRLFHPDGRIEVTWFEGLASEFVDASARMGASDLRTKHLVTAPVATFSADGTRALAETNAVIIGENVKLALGCNAHSRFFDRIERRDGSWRILDRRCIYDVATFTYPGAPVDIDAVALARHPREYGALAYLLDASGFPVQRTFPTKGSGQERDIKQAARDWLNGQDHA
ncbi:MULTISPECIES: nuclear transport factor 2 family protein [unclassified Streptomyces]|uniref:nuclear transport factor 2 family protein n=1 Tax=unclassified Streptomyces TaxID=2593676 RepID=UPI0035DC8A26